MVSVSFENCKLSFNMQITHPDIHVLTGFALKVKEYYTLITIILIIILLYLWTILALLFLYPVESTQFNFISCLGFTRRIVETLWILFICVDVQYIHQPYEPLYFVYNIYYTLCIIPEESSFLNNCVGLTLEKLSW